MTAQEAPRLFELIEKVRAKTGAPRPDRVLIDGELNAAVWQQPRLGLLGWHRNHLSSRLAADDGLVDTPARCGDRARVPATGAARNGVSARWIYPHALQLD